MKLEKPQMFTNLLLHPIYSSYDNDLVEEFYNPILREAVRFDRISAYFSAKSLALYASGLEYFAKQGHKYRLIVSHEISIEDYEEIKKGYSIKRNVKEEIIEGLRENITLREKKEISNLAYLISIDVVQIKVAFVKKGIFHDKCGILYDDIGNIICFRGSNNETEAALNNNYEAFTVTCNWVLDSMGFYKQIIDKSKNEFEKLWNNKHDKIIVLEAEEVIMNEILKHNKNEVVFDEIIFEEDCIVLDYSNRLVLKLNTDNHEWITQGTFYKLRIKKYVESINDEYIYFKETLSYLDYENIIKLIENKASSVGVNFFTTKRLRDYIEARNVYIEKRATLGIEIKKQEKKLYERFFEYKEVVDSNMSRQLREKQMWDSFFMTVMNKSGNFSVPGSGKTSSVLGMYAFLKARGSVKRIVMIGPKNAFGSWIDEFNICFNGKEELKLFNIHDIGNRSLKDRRKAIVYETGGSNLLLFNYEALGSYKQEIIELIDEETLLVFDEVHKVKRVEGETPGIYASNALDISKKAIYIVAMTGTPIPNSYVDLYNMLHILFNDEYDEFFRFSPQLLKNITPEERKEVNNKIQPFFCRTTKKQLQVPEINEDIINYVRQNETEQKLFEIIVAKYRKNKLALFIRLLQLESNPKLLLESVDISEFKYILDYTQDVEDMDFVDYSDDIRSLVDSIELTSKMKAALNQATELVREGKKVIIWCVFKKSIEDFRRHLMNLGINVKCIYGEVELNSRLDIIQDFKDKKIDILITNPHTLAESVSLHTVCHDAIYFEYSYNLVHMLQSKDRIHRLGLPENQYTQYYFMQSIFEYDGDDFSIDSKIYDRLKEKEQIMLDAIDNNQLEDVVTAEEDLDLIFRRLGL